MSAQHAGQQSRARTSPQGDVAEGAGIAETRVDVARNAENAADKQFTLLSRPYSPAMAGEIGTSSIALRKRATAFRFSSSRWEIEAP